MNMEKTKKASVAGGAAIAGSGGVACTVAAYLATSMGITEPEIISLMAGVIGTGVSFLTYWIRNNMGEDYAKIVESNLQDETGE